MQEFRSTNGHKPQSNAKPFETKPIPLPAGSKLKLEQLIPVQQIEPNTKIRRRNLKLGRLSDVMPQPVQWLWPDRIARKVVLFTGLPDCGKTTAAIDIAARVTRGSAWPDGSGIAPAPAARAVAATAISAVLTIYDQIRELRAELAATSCHADAHKPKKS